MVHFRMPKASLAVEKVNVTHGIIKIIDDCVTDNNVNTGEMLNMVMAHCENMKKNDF